MKSNLFFLVVVFLFYFSVNSRGQEKINLSVGFGILELANVGVHYQIKQTQIGVSFGTISWNNGNVFSVLGDLHLHFGDYSKLASRKPWYVRFGLNYLLHEKTNVINTYFYLNGRIGREFNISKKIGLYVDLGANFEVGKEKKRNTPEQEGPTGGPYEYPMIPAIGAGIYYNFD